MLLNGKHVSTITVKSQKVSKKNTGPRLKVEIRKT